LQQSPNKQSSDAAPSVVIAAQHSCHGSGEMSCVAHPPEWTAGTSNKKVICNQGNQQNVSAAGFVDYNNVTGQTQLKPLKEALQDLHDMVAAMEQLCNPCLCADGELDSLGRCSPCTLTDKPQVEDAHKLAGLPLAQARPSSACETGVISENSSTCKLQGKRPDMQPVSNRGRPMNLHLLRGRLHKLHDRLGNLETRMLAVAALQDTGCVGDNKSSFKGSRGSAAQEVRSPLQHFRAIKDRRQIKGSTIGGVTQVAGKPQAGATAQPRYTIDCGTDSSHPSHQTSGCHAVDDNSHLESSSTVKQQILVAKMQQEMDSMTREIDHMKTILPHVYGFTS